MGTGSLLVTWMPPTVLHLDMTVSSPNDFRWVRAWLEQYLDSQPPGSNREADYSFFYVVIGDLLSSEPDGHVDGTAILEAGLGGPPVGPPGAPTTTVNNLVSFALECLTR
jgi:hypothetical protein